MFSCKMNERGEYPQNLLSTLLGVFDRVDAEVSVFPIANLRNVRQPRMESYALRGHDGRRRMDGRGGQAIPVYHDRCRGIL